MWLDARTWEFVGSGVLELVVEGPGTGYGVDRYRDAKTVSVEKKLPRVFRAIEIHRLQTEWRGHERRREAADRQRRLGGGHARSKTPVRRAGTLGRATKAVTRLAGDHTGHREFPAVVRRAAGGYRGPQHDELMAHLDFAERRLDERDSIKHLGLVRPEVPDPKPDDLKPFLDG